jgi:hypothetical protein
MSDEKLNILYQFKFEKSNIYFNTEIDPKTMTIKIDPLLKKQEWMKLDFCKCGICPLDPKDHEFCPLALATAKPLVEFRTYLSTDPVLVTVKTAERYYVRDCDLQIGLSSLLGLLMATSECPFFHNLKPMARFHLPFATFQETMYRVSSMFLLREHFLKKPELKISFADMLETYNKLQTVNRDYTNRLRKIAREDTDLNAVINLDNFAQLITFSVEQDLEELAFLFTK